LSKSAGVANPHADLGQQFATTLKVCPDYRT
jgi:hypothetical protein